MARQESPMDIGISTTSGWSEDQRRKIKEWINYHGKCSDYLSLCLIEEPTKEGMPKKPDCNVEMVLRKREKKTKTTKAKPSKRISDMSDKDFHEHLLSLTCDENTDDLGSVMPTETMDQMAAYLKNAYDVLRKNEYQTLNVYLKLGTYLSQAKDRFATEKKHEKLKGSWEQWNTAQREAARMRRRLRRELYK